MDPGFIGIFVSCLFISFNKLQLLGAYIYLNTVYIIIFILCKKSKKLILSHF